MLRVYLIQACYKDGVLVNGGRDFVVPAFNKKEAIDIFKKLKSVYDICSIRLGNKKEISEKWDIEKLYNRQIEDLKLLWRK